LNIYWVLFFFKTVRIPSVTLYVLLRILIYKFNGKTNLIDKQVQIQFHFSKKTFQGEGKCILLSLSEATVITDSEIYWS